MEDINQDTIIFHLSEEQAKILCKIYNEDYDKLEEYEICELLDKLIDNYA